MKVALEKKAQRIKEHQVMDEEPLEVGAAQKKFLPILETVHTNMQQLQACMDKQESHTTTGTDISRYLGAEARSQAVSWNTHADV